MDDLALIGLLSAVICYTCLSIIWPLFDYLDTKSIKTIKGFIKFVIDNIYEYFYIIFTTIIVIFCILSLLIIIWKH